MGPDGAYDVGELTGAPSVPGWSRLWRIEPGASHVVCPSGACKMIADGFTSIIDVAFGPDGWLYVVEYDENGWLSVVVGGPIAGGTVNRCDPSTGSCEVVASGLTLPSAITLDKWGGLWLLENNVIAPTVRRIDYQPPGTRPHRAGGSVPVPSGSWTARRPLPVACPLQRSPEPAATGRASPGPPPSGAPRPGPSETSPG